MKDEALQGTSSALHHEKEPVAARDFGQRLARLEGAHDHMATGVQLANTETRLNTRIDGVEKQLNTRIDGVEKRLNKRIDGVEKRLNKRMDGMASKADLADLEKRLRADLASKADLAVLETKMLRYMIYTGVAMLSALLPLLIFIALAV